MRFSLSQLATPPAIAVAIFVSSCRHAPLRSADGASAFQFIKPEPPPSRPEKRQEPAISELSPTQVFIDAEPIEPLDKPLFPARAALAKNARLSSIGVKLVISPAGRVIEVAPSYMALSTPSPFTDDFRAAIAKAVRTWRFNPAEIRQVKPEQKGNGPIYWVVTSAERVETTVHVSFTFTANGEVLSRPLSGAK